MFFIFIEYIILGDIINIDLSLFIFIYSFIDVVFPVPSLVCKMIFLYEKLCFSSSPEGL